MAHGVQDECFSAIGAILSQKGREIEFSTSTQRGELSVNLAAALLLNSCCTWASQRHIEELWAQDALIHSGYWELERLHCLQHFRVIVVLVYLVVLQEKSLHQSSLLYAIHMLFKCIICWVTTCMWLDCWHSSPVQDSGRQQTHHLQSLRRVTSRSPGPAGPSGRLGLSAPVLTLIAFLSPASPSPHRPFLLPL